MQLLPYNVLLKSGWSNNLTWIELNQWMRQNKIDSDDWDYYTSGVVNPFNAAVGFRNEHDALAFKLKFNVSQI